MKILVVDTETSGLDPERHAILSVGLVVWESTRLLADLEVFVRENDVALDSEAQEIHGISRETIDEKGLPPSAVVDTIETFLEGAGWTPGGAKVALGGHNVAFDVSFLKRLYRLAGRDFGSRFSHRLLDTASIYQFLMLAHLIPESEPSSDAAFGHFGIEVTRRHSALGDARATATLLNHLLDVVRGPKLASLRKPLRIKRRGLFKRKGFGAEEVLLPKRVEGPMKGRARTGHAPGHGSGA